MKWIKFLFLLCFLVLISDCSSIISISATNTPQPTITPTQLPPLIWFPQQWRNCTFLMCGKVGYIAWNSGNHEHELQYA